MIQFGICKRVKKIEKLETLYFKILQNPTKYPNRFKSYVFSKYMKKFNYNSFSKNKDVKSIRNFLQINKEIFLFSKFLLKKKLQRMKRHFFKIKQKNKSENFLKLEFKDENECFIETISKKKISKMKLKKEKKKIQKNYLKPILSILKKIWLGKEKTIKIEEILKCKNYHLLILKSIIKRKFGFDLEINNYFIMLQQCNKLNKKIKLKREDEKVKYIFNKFIDLIKKINNNKSNFYEFFYEKYLKNSISRKVYENYFVDSKKKMIGVFYNSHFVKIFLSTNNLKKIFLDFSLIFKKNLGNSIDEKFLELLINFDNFFDKDYFKFRDYLTMMENNDFSFRLPWDSFQIDEAFKYHFQSANFN